MTIRTRAPAKINLSLDVLCRRPDGYHDLKMVMASVSLYDDLTITLGRCEPGRETFSCLSDDPRLPSDDRNLAARAARLFFEETTLSGWSCHIGITKRIPVCAGLGGGSSDGAAVLRALAAWRPVPEGVLAGIALKLGSDVPYCLRGGVCLAEGRGEILTPLPPAEGLVVLTVPPVEVSTAEAFAEWDRTGSLPEPEGVANVKRALTGAGARGVAMSGTGPATFGIFDAEMPANQAYRTLLELFPNTFLLRFV